MICPKPECNGRIFETAMGLKKHLTMSHGGWNLEDLKTAGAVVSDSDIARSMTPGRFNSLASVAEGAPDRDSDAEPGEGRENRSTSSQSPRKPYTRKQKGPNDAEIELLRKATIARCRRMAKLPYSMWAAITGDPSLRLNPEEEEELTAGYVALFEAYGWQVAGKLWAWLDLTAAHCALIAVRSDVMKNLFAGQQEQPQEELAN